MGEERHAAGAGGAPGDQEPFAALALERGGDGEEVLARLTETMPSSTLAWQWSQDRAQAVPVTDTGRNGLGLAGRHSGVSQRLSPGA